MFMGGMAIINKQHYVIALHFGCLGAKGHQVQRWRKGIAMAAPTEDELEDFIKDQRWKVKRCRDLQFSAVKRVSASNLFFPRLFRRFEASMKVLQQSLPRDGSRVIYPNSLSLWPNMRGQQELGEEQRRAEARLR